MYAIGFDVGNENCVIAAAKGGGIEVLDNEYSLRLTPSYVGFSGYSRNIGVAAKNKIIPNLRNTIFNFKTILGKKFFDKFTSRELTYLPYDVVELASGDVGVEVYYQNEQVKFSIHQISAMLLTKLKSIAEHKTGSKIQDCIISVPIYFTDVQRRALLDAAEIAGLKTSQLLNESTAAALYYGFYKRDMFQTGQKVVVFVDLGHSALTVTACKFYEEKLSILGSLWNLEVGGRHFDSILVKYFADDFEKRYNINIMPNRKALMTLFLECEVLKKQMSANPQELEINIECLIGDTDVRGKMKRELFEELSASLLSAIEETMEDLIAKCHLEKQDIETVQIIGGSSRIPALKSIIFKVFGQYPQTTLNQDEAVARGCCLQCALLSPNLMTKSYQIEDIQPFAISVIYKTEKFTEEIPIFNRFHKVPSTRVITFTYKGPFTLEAYYESETREFENIGKFCFTNIPQDIQNSSRAKVEVKVSLDTNGIFNILSAKIIAKYGINLERSSAEAQNLAIVPFDDQTLPKDIMEQDLSINIEKISETEENLTDKDLIKYYDLEFVSILPRVDKSDVTKYKMEEQKMRENDLRSQRIADLRNEFEEYIIFVRQKLKAELCNFVSEEIKGNISQHVNESENWLYESDDLQDENEFHKQLNELKREFQPVLNKYERTVDVKNALHEFQKFLELCAKDMQAVSEKTKNHRQYVEIEERWKAASDYVRLHLNAIDRVKLSEELEISATWIREEIKSFQDMLQQICKLDSKPTNEPSLEKSDESEAVNLMRKPEKSYDANSDKHEKIRQVPIELKYKE